MALTVWQPPARLCNCLTCRLLTLCQAQVRVGGKEKQRGRNRERERKRGRRTERKESGKRATPTQLYLQLPETAALPYSQLSLLLPHPNASLLLSQPYSRTYSFFLSSLPPAVQRLFCCTCFLLFRSSASALSLSLCARKTHDSLELITLNPS